MPFVDALTTILDPSLPLTVTEWEEWGNPLDDPEVYAYMKLLHALRERHRRSSYPAILAETSLNDTRVLYVEPAKWVARLRATVTNDEAERRSCCAPRWRPATAASAAGTTPGSSTPGSSPS